MGRAETIEIARNWLATNDLPEDLSLRITGPDAPTEWLQGLAEVALSQEVWPSSGGVLRGIDAPGFGMVAVDADGRAVSTACAAKSRHPDHPDAAMAQWGQLATRDDWKGKGVARAMACHSIVHGADAFEIEVFSTGIREGNAPSENLCRSLGLTPSGYAIVILIDPARFGGARITK